MKTSMRFDLVDLRLFLFVVEASSITHGAARAGMALASASERVRLMEESLGAPLLERHRRGVRATAAGAALAHHAQLVVQQLERMRGELSEFADGFRARVRLLANTTATAEFLPATLAAFLAQHPLIDIELEERSSREIVRAVAGNLAEIGVVGDEVNPAKELQTFPFAEDRLVLIALPRRPGGCSESSWPSRRLCHPPTRFSIQAALPVLERGMGRFRLRRLSYWTGSLPWPRNSSRGGAGPPRHRGLWG
jgi:molybdate transport repressor ModE-like protein